MARHITRLSEAREEAVRNGLRSGPFTTLFGFQSTAAEVIRISGPSGPSPMPGRAHSTSWPTMPASWRWRSSGLVHSFP